MSTHCAIVFSFIDRYASLILTMASSIIIARLITPDQIRVFSVTMVLLAFPATLRDLGAGEYLVQEKELTVSRIRAVWAVQLGLELILAIIVLIAAFPVAAFYEEPEMEYIMLVISANYAISPFGSLTYAYLSREMRFDSIALIRFIGIFVGTIVSIALAMLDYGAISLAYGIFVTTAVSATTTAYFRTKSFPWILGISGLFLRYGLRLKHDYSNARSAFWHLFTRYPNHCTAKAFLEIVLKKLEKPA